MRKKKKYKEKFTAPAAKVLVVDDNSMNLMVFKSLLKQTQIQIDAALNGDEGIILTQKNKYDIIFLDHMMPDKDGIETLQELRAQKKNPNWNTVAVCLTANAVSGAREKYIAAGFDNYLTKPINPNKLEEMLLEYLPKEKVAGAAEDIEEKIQPALPQENFKYINFDVGLEYSAGMEDIFKSGIEIFCNLKDENKQKIQAAFDGEDWKNYTIFVHALKSTSLSIGGEKCSAAAKQLEMSGKILTDENSSPEDKSAAAEYIKNHHAELMELYDKLVDEAKRYLNEQ